MPSRAVSLGPDRTAGVWEAPGPGMWEIDTGHYNRTASRLSRDLMEEVAEAGLTIGMEMMGAPLKTMQAAFVNGQLYFRLVPLVGGGRNTPTPPRPVLWLVTRLHPVFRKRAKRSIAALDERVWLQEFARWERDWKPKLIAANERLGEVDVTALSDDDLAAHLSRVWEHLRWSGALHFRLHASDLGPIGRLLVAAIDWGLDERVTMATLAGSSPATSAPKRAIAELADELRSCGCDPRSLDDVRAASDGANELLTAYLTQFGKRLTTGYDLRDATLEELPDVVVSSIRHSSTSDDDGAAARRGDEAFNALLTQLPDAHRAQFTMLVEDARILYGLRDENGPLTFEWPAGVARAAVLEAARRLVAGDRIVEIEHIFDASMSEITAMLLGSGPPADDLAQRCAERFSWADLVPPEVLGRVSETPDVTVLPGRMPEMMRAVLTVTALLDPEALEQRGEHHDHLHGDPNAESNAQLVGTGIGSESYRGIARVVASADEAFERAEPGDIIVTRLTVPTFNSILAMAGGVVTEGGGLLSHTAVIARELGIPAVVGVIGALTRIPDGAEIEIDPVAGRVTVIGSV